VIAFALALAAAVPTQASLLGPGDLVSAEILPPPPPANSLQARAERTELEAIERTRSSAAIDAAKHDSATKDALIFGEAIGRGFRLDRLPQTALLMSMVRSTEKAVADRAKVHFRRPRPWIANPAIAACSRDDDALSSYPSGHATMAFSMGAVLGRLVPDRAAEIMARAAAYGESRLVCEVHYRSDVTAGEALGLMVAERLMAKRSFIRQFQLARAELIQVGIIRGGAGEH
jgi:acid phosphatase (class A)